jgi:superfamily II DNA or RNA helicase
MEHRSEILVGITHDAARSIEKSELVARAQTELVKPQSGEQYSRQYLERIVSTYLQLGVVRQTQEEVTLYKFGREWIRGDIPFETFLWYAVKQKWALEGEFPEGIKGLYHVHQVVKRADDPLRAGEIRSRLAETYDYEFNVEGIRGYPTLLLSMGALEQTDRGYVTTAPERFSERFRNADVLWQLEQWLKREGPNADPPPERVKRDLAKYYMYRESGGHGRHRRLLETARSHYLDDGVLTDSAEPKVQRSDPYTEQQHLRRTLRDSICDRLEMFEPRDLAGLSTEALERLNDAESEREASRIKEGAGSGLSRADIERVAQTERVPYTFPAEFSLYEWQTAAVEEWFTDGDTAPEQGIAQVVTGAGKTVMALELVRQWLNYNNDGVVTVVVPTKVLLRQWLEELTQKLAVPPEEIGWLGDGTKDGFEDGYRVLVAIVNSAVRDGNLASSVAHADTTEHLLIADECHRYTGDTFSMVFDCDRSASLGLSATPLENSDSSERTPADELLVSELGDIYYELSYDEGLKRGLIPQFRINYVGFELTDAERTAYDRLTDAIVDAVTEIKQRYQNRLHELEGSFPRKVQAIKKTRDGPTPAISDYFQVTQERRELIADAVARQAITLQLLQRTVDNEQKAIVFQERIEQLERMVAPKETRGRSSRTGEVVETGVDRMQLYEQYPELETVDQRLEDLFFKSKYRPVMYHSGHRSDAWNDFAIDWFSDEGFANVMLSVKALIEGVDVPSADVGLVRVSSGSVRQRIQTLGRVLRTGDDPEERAQLYVLYARNTVDADIFERYDWREELKRADVRHLTWDTDEGSINGTLREATTGEIPSPPPEKTVPDSADLSQGDSYNGPQRGYQFSVDADGRPFERTGNGRRYIENNTYRDVATYVHSQKGGGTVTVNEANHALTYIGDELVFAGVVEAPDSLAYSEEENVGLTDEPDVDFEDL